MPIYARSHGFQIKVQVTGNIHQEQFNGTAEDAKVREAVIQASLRQGLPSTLVEEWHAIHLPTNAPRRTYG